ncbi:MAG: SAM-dependent methyltransferase, partial [Deltaproteobacteria bacterium]|nr:SAM-dependent methyltransferase [Deltaproteobacteria bacterium]
MLSENYLYTSEAFGEYFAHLKEDGILSMIRWVFNPPRETLRLCTQGVEMLRRFAKTPHPENHFVVLRQGKFASFLLKKNGFSP